MRRVVSLLVSLAILLLIYARIDLHGLLLAFRQSDAGWMAASLGLVVPLTLLTGWRLQQLLPDRTGLTFGEANRLILAASVLNMVLPSKMGDIAKAYFMQQRGRLDGALALALVVFEKACDMLSLLVWCAFGLALYPDKGPAFWGMTGLVAGGLVAGGLLLGSAGVAQAVGRGVAALAPARLGARLGRLREAWAEMQRYVGRDRGRLLRVAATSIVIWLLHLVQIWLFIRALGAWTPLLASLALAPLAILAGLVPLTFAGVGTRDAALIVLYRPFLDAPTAAALGLLCTARYVLPALGGLPFLGHYLATLRELRPAPRP